MAEEIQPKKNMTALGCVAYCVLVLFWPLLVGLAGAGFISVFGDGGEWWSRHFATGMSGRSYVLLGVLLECLWLVGTFQGAKALLIRQKREQTEQSKRKRNNET